MGKDETGTETKAKGGPPRLDRILTVKLDARTERTLHNLTTAYDMPNDSATIRRAIEIMLCAHCSEILGGAMTRCELDEYGFVVNVPLWPVRTRRPKRERVGV